MNKYREHIESNHLSKMEKKGRKKKVKKKCYNDQTKVISPALNLRKTISFNSLKHKVTLLNAVFIYLSYDTIFLKAFSIQCRHQFKENRMFSL